MIITKVTKQSLEVCLCEKSHLDESKSLAYVDFLVQKIEEQLSTNNFNVGVGMIVRKDNNIFKTLFVGDYIKLPYIEMTVNYMIPSVPKLVIKKVISIYEEAYYNVSINYVEGHPILTVRLYQNS